MRIIVTHTSPDMDAITSAWIIRRFLDGWEDAKVRFVPAGQRLLESKQKDSVIENIDGNYVIHVDTGLGPLDHHQTSDEQVCAASLVWDYVRKTITGKKKWKIKSDAVSRIVRVVVDIDHFKEVFWLDPMSDYQEFSLINILEGIKLIKPDDDVYYVDFISKIMDALLCEFENRIFSENIINKEGVKFNTRFGKAIAFETVNDSVLKLAQKMGYVIVARKDPRKGYVRIKARPFRKGEDHGDVDLTPAYEKLIKLDPNATWFLHVSKKMLLNGTVKNPRMKVTTLALDDIIKVLKNV